MRQAIVSSFPKCCRKGSTAQSTERRWQRFMDNGRILVRMVYLPLVLAALQG